MHILKNGNEKMQCCDSSKDRPSVIRHYPNPNRPCDFEGQPSVFEDEHCHSWQCADEQNWPDDWTMECLVCGYNRRDDFFLIMTISQDVVKEELKLERWEWNRRFPLRSTISPPELQEGGLLPYQG
jgi:hypothetical protein